MAAGNLPLFGKVADVDVGGLAAFFAGVGVTAFEVVALELVLKPWLRVAVALVGERLADKVVVCDVSALVAEVEGLMTLGLRAGGFLS